MSKKVTILLTAIALLALVLVTTASAEVGVTEGDNGLPNASHRLIVQLDSPALAVWASSSEISAAANLMVDGRLNVQADAAQDYIQQLEAEQVAFTANLAAAVPGAQAATFVDATGASATLAYQVVFNGVVVELPSVTPENIKALANMSGVKQVLRDYEQKPAMYASLPLIGAPTMWEQLGGQGMSGEGVIFASIDTGVYVPNPFFDPTGYAYPDGYPVGDTSVTSEKVIGARAYFRPWDPPLPGDDGALPGPAGSSHGTHTSGTVAGNADTVAEIAGLTETISGVAPKAQILSYKIGYPTHSAFSGSAFDAEIVMAYEDAVMDGAQVINYSFGGYNGVMPWASATAIARDAAWDAGVFVSHSAGNSGREGYSTTGDASQKVMEVAASTTTGTIASGRFNVTAPEPVPGDLTDIPYAEAAFGAPLPVGAIVGPFPYLTSTAVDPNNFEGCNPWPAGTFDGVAAVISRGACQFGTKVLNAEQAGADFVVIYNHAAGGEGLVSMAPGDVGNQVTISSIFIGHTNGLALVDWYDTNGAASEFAVDTFGFQAGNVPDVIASFSSRGPAFANFLEPDVTAPGVNILSAGYGSGGGLDALMGFGQASGTSMAAPHVAGSAALLTQMHPTWTPTQIMSALMSTSTTEVWLDAAHTVPAGVLDMGAGRIDLTKAGDPGLTFDYPSLSFGSHSDALTVTATDVSGLGGIYNLSAMSDVGIVVSVDPTSLTFAADETLSFDVMVDTTGAAPGDYGGFVYLDDGTHMAHLPLWVRVEAPLGDAKVLLIDNDMSDLLGFPDYSMYYADALAELGWDFDYYNADIHFNNPQTLPSAAALAAYDVIVYWSGDNYYPDGTFAVSTPLTLVDMRVLSDWMFNGGRFFASGQDLASAWDATDGGFLYEANLGAKYLQDSMFDPGYAGILPPAPSVVGQPGTAFGGLTLDLSGAGDGAANQYYVDEIAIAPFGDLGAPETVSPAFAALDGSPVADGYTGAARAAYPSLEEPMPPYDYRSLYLAFGLEGVNNDTGFSTREDLLDNALAWLLDSNDAMIHEGIVDVDSIGTSYRWDFGDGSPFTDGNASNIAGHAYDAAGVYAVRVEATNGMGSRALGELSYEVTAEMVGMMQNFTAEMVSTYMPPDPLPTPVTIEIPLMADTWVDGGDTATNFDMYAALVARTTGLDNALLTFDRGELPEGVEIMNAELTLNATFESGAFGKELAVLNTESFDTMTVTYDTAPAVYNPGDAVPVAMGMMTFDVTANVAAWDAVGAQATEDSHMGQLAISATGPWGRVVFDSLETYEAKPVMLTVTYRPAE